MANISVLYGNCEVANTCFQSLEKKYKTLMVHSSTTSSAIKILQNEIESPIEIEYRAIVVYGLDDASRNTALTFVSFFENLTKTCTGIGIRAIIFVVECANTDADADACAFKAVLDPPMNPRYLTGEE